MLGVKTYPQDYIDRCRTRIDSTLAAYSALAAGAKPGSVTAFEVAFLSSMVLVLDEMFVHRLRTVEGKDGNPLNEVRVLCESILTNDGQMVADRSIKLVPSKSILGYAPGDEIVLTPESFTRLATAYFTEIERKFGEPPM